MKSKVLITGSSRGLGNSIGHIFSENNWEVCFTSRHKSDLDLIKEKYPNKKHLYHVTDFSIAQQVQNLSQFLNNEWGNIDSLIINVGGGTGERSITSKFTNNFQIFQSNFTTAFLTSQILNFLLLKSKNPKIILIGSIAAHINVGSPINYAIAKKSLENLAISLSLSLSTFKIKVNCIHIGHTLTQDGYWANVKKNDPNFFIQLTKNKTLTNQLLDPFDIANFIFEISNSQYANNFTGNSFILDCGTSIIK